MQIIEVNGNLFQPALFQTKMKQDKLKQFFNTSISAEISKYVSLGMQLGFHLPDKELATIVQYFWTLEIHASSDSPFVHRCFAHTAPEMLFHCTGKFDRLSDEKDVCFTAGIQAQHHSFRRFMATSDTSLFGVRFHHHALREIFGMDASDFTAHMPSLQDLMGKAASELEDKMISARSHQDRIAILSAYFKMQLSKRRKVRSGTAETVRFLLSGKGLYSIGRLADFSCLSERQFERNFRETTGMGPKLFSRITRFRHVLDQTDTASLTQLAIDSGYYDQSHFIRDFQTFSGYTPSDYFSGNLGVERFTV